MKTYKWYINRLLVIIFPLCITPSAGWCGEAQAVSLRFYVVSQEPVVGGRYIDTPECPKAGYVGDTADLVITRLLSVSTNLSHIISHQSDEFPGEIRTDVNIQMFKGDAGRLAYLTSRNFGYRILVMLGDRPLRVMVVKDIYKSGRVQISALKSKDVQAIVPVLKTFVRHDDLRDHPTETGFAAVAAICAIYMFCNVFTKRLGESPRWVRVALVLQSACWFAWSLLKFYLLLWKMSLPLDTRAAILSLSHTIGLCGVGILVIMLLGGITPMKTSAHRLQRGSSVVLAFAALAFVVLAILWPAAIADIFHSRWVLSVLATWSIGLAIFLHPEISSGLARGFREFRKASDEVAREIRGDDDDGPRAA